MAVHSVTLIPGDGIGAEVSAAAVRIVAATGVTIEWEKELAGGAAVAEYRDPLPTRVLESIRRNRVALKGPTETPFGSGYRSVNVQMRRELGLYANLRPVRAVRGTKRKFDQIDLLVVRENTEDLYCGIENVIVPGVVTALKLVTEAASTKIARFAFEQARSAGRKHITAGHKSNILKLTDGLFLRCVRAVAAEYPEIRYDEIVVDNLCTQLVLDPAQFDVLVLQNVYGDLISDLCAGLIGGLGLAPGANVGDGIAVFESAHGSAPDIAEKNVANPTAMTLSAALMLDHLGEHAAAERIRAAITKTVAFSNIMTFDIGGNASTTEFTDAVIRHLDEDAA